MTKLEQAIKEVMNKGYAYKWLEMQGLHEFSTENERILIYDYEDSKKTVEEIQNKFRF